MFVNIIEVFKQYGTGTTFVLGLLSIVLLIIFASISRRFLHRVKMILSPIERMKIKEKLTQSELELQMLNLSYSHKNVRWMKHNLVISNRNQLAYGTLNKIRNSLSLVSPEIIALIPAARWLFDNFQMLYRELKKVKTTGTSRKIIPVLQDGEFRGYPRIYVVARKMVTLTGGYLNEESISFMIQAYQKELPLTTAEIWALPEMIGFCLLEVVVELAGDILHITETKSKADIFVRNNLNEQTDIIDVSSLLQRPDKKYRENIPFHSHVIYLLKNMSFDESSIQRYVEYQYKYNTKYSKPSDIFQEEGEIESLLESNIRTFLVSLRETVEIDGEELFENLSVLEHTLLKDPDGIYVDMDSESRARYRAVIEKLAVKNNIDENLIAEICLTLAVEGRENLKSSHHVGCYLVGEGRSILKAQVLDHPEPERLTPRRNLQGTCYFITFALFFVAFYVSLAYVLRESGIIAATYVATAFLSVSLLLVIGMALETTNIIFTRLIPVRELQALDFIKGIPERARTFLVMPVIISSKDQALEYLDRLERHFLSNRQSNLFFALLVDFEDADILRKPQDDDLENFLSLHIGELNDLYPLSPQRFSVLIRSRKWNESEGCFMGWERKRGKLEEFNALLSGEQDTSFTTIVSDKSIFNTFKYVITLDADSILLKDNAAKLVGIIEHPLNQPVIDPIKKRIKSGYAIIQPSITSHIYNGKGNLFYRVFAGKQGLDQYCNAISDIYHDVFNEGIFLGKGIYHVETFYTILNKKIPENRVLSHDLLESCYVRTAFSSSVKIIDDYPSNLLSHAKRDHRWIRGDWQLLPWLFKRNTLACLSKWKILDDLRASLVPLCKVILIILNLALLPQAYYLWLPIVFFSDALALFFLFYDIIRQKISRPRLALVYRDLLKDIMLQILRFVLEMVFLPYNAYIALDAILRTLYRLLKSKKNLLMWNTAEKVEKHAPNTRMDYFVHMSSSLIPSAIIIGLLFVVDISFVGMIFYGILSVLWGLSYWVAYSISQTSSEIQIAELPEDEEMLREIARKTWQFFKDFSKSDNNWLCPDNYQQEPTERITTKTSPTNIGFQLISTLSARDLGFETLTKTLEYLENILCSVTLLPRWKGHLFNWYDIKTLEVLNPQYVSTVDSGNFLAYLITLKNGLLDLIDSPVFSYDVVRGLRDTMKICKYDLKLKEKYDTIGDFINDIEEIKNIISTLRTEQWEGTRTIREMNRSIDSIISEVEELELKDLSFTSVLTLRQMTQRGNFYAKTLMHRLEDIVYIIDIVSENIDFRFLYNEKRKLFNIGFNLSSLSLDEGCYDLMASEACLTSFITIAMDTVPVEHWYKLQRPHTIVNGIPCFVSWSGTMFEYLLPNLIMSEYKGSVFAKTSMAAVIQHIKYGKKMGIPWGISESQHYNFDQCGNYQYKAFGVPELRLQPSLTISKVVAPYATFLALAYAKEECFANLKKMAELGCIGEYGYYESIDFNGPDPVALTPYSIIKSFMAHHQGMILVSINNLLNGKIMQRRFRSEAFIQAAESLLEEKRNSYYVSLSRKGYNIQVKAIVSPEETYANRHVNKVAPKIPVAHYLSINDYSMMMTSDGDGFSDYKGMMLYRWRSDLYASTGSYIYIKDIKSGEVWSSTYNPTKKEPDDYKVEFSIDQAEIKRTDGDISTHTLVNLSPAQNIEFRKVTLTNHGSEKRQIELTSYMEVVLDTYLAELSHPAFNKLFIESSFIEGHNIFLSKRRGTQDVNKPYLVHMVKSSMKPIGSIEYENDRLKFIGRNNTVQNPEAVVGSLQLSNITGFSNDPIVSLRIRVELEAENTVDVYFITGVCSNNDEAVRISEELNNLARIDDLNKKFRLQSYLELKYLDITSAQLKAFLNLISPIFYPSRYYRGPIENIRRNSGTQCDLWRFGVSGDRPIMLLRVNSIEQIGTVKDVFKAYEYLRLNNVDVDLIVLSDAKYGYMQELDDLLNELTCTMKIYTENRKKPSLFILHSYQMIPREIDLLLTVARVVFTEKTGIYFRDIKAIL